MRESQVIMYYKSCIAFYNAHNSLSFFLQINQIYLELSEEALLGTAFTTRRSYMYLNLNKTNIYQCFLSGILKKIYKVLPEYVESTLQGK